MTQTLPATSPDVEKWLIATFGPGAAPVIIRNQRPPGAPTPTQPLALIRTDLQGHVTAISRYCRVTIQGRAVYADGSADLETAFTTGANLAARVVAAPRTGILVDAEHQSGPYRVLDPDLGVEYTVTNLLLEVLAI